VQKRIVSSVRTVCFVSGRMSYVTIRIHWCNIIVPKVHGISEEESGDVKDSSFEEMK
jgi:hypothetical protein